MREIPTAQKIVGGTAPGAILSRLSQNLYHEAAWMKGEELAAALDHYFDVLTACIRRDAAQPAAVPELKVRILGFIEAHLEEQTLSPSVIAEAIGISVRHLHRVFSVTGCNVGDYIRVLRLDQCRFVRSRTAEFTPSPNGSRVCRLCGPVGGITVIPPLKSA